MDGRRVRRAPHPGVVRGRYETGYALRRLACASALVSDLLGGLCVLAGVLGALVVDDVLEGVFGFFIGLVLGAALVGMGILIRAAAEALRATLDTAVHTRVALEVLESVRSGTSVASE